MIITAAVYIFFKIAENTRGGTLYIFGWWGAAGTLKPLPYTRPCSADFATLYSTRHRKPLPYPRPATFTIISLLVFFNEKPSVNNVPR